MSFKYITKIPTAKEIVSEIPLSESLKTIKAERDEEVSDIMTGKSNKLLMIIGPCSADFEKSVCEYVSKLAKVQDKVKDKIIMVPRIYTNKPRTTGEGYKGMMHQPNPSGNPDIVEGIKTMRKLHMKAISESGLTSADEMLYPENYPYLADLLSYVAIGARSVENQQHRLTVSGMDIPAGMKNPTSGDIGVMFNSIKAAQISHNFIYNGYEVETSGNPLAHAILRGAVNQNGDCIPNYHYENLAIVSEEYEKRGYMNPSLIVDTNHSNSMKKFDEQTRIAKEIIHNKLNSPSLNKLVKGLMIESYLVDGRQDNPDTYGQSITDPCLGWEKSEKLIYEIADQL